MKEPTGVARGSLRIVLAQGDGLPHDLNPAARPSRKANLRKPAGYLRAAFFFEAGFFLRAAFFFRPPPAFPAGWNEFLASGRSS